MVHAQLATAPATPRADAPPARDAAIPDLYYYPDTARLRTPFRDAAIEFIYQAALEVDDGRLKYGYVYVYTPHIDDVETLDLVLVVDTKDWNAISAWMREINGAIIEWEAGLSDAQKKDARTRVEFGYLPAIYDNASS